MTPVDIQRLRDCAAYHEAEGRSMESLAQGRSSNAANERHQMYMKAAVQQLEWAQALTAAIAALEGKAAP